VVQALRHARIGAAGIAVRVQREPFRRKGARADTFYPDRFAGRLRHVEITFPEPVAGPLVIGDGRWLGFGVMAPAPDEPPPAVHLFAIDPAEAPPVAMRATLTRALRNAVMARVDRATAGSRRRGEKLPTFFTGHLEGGAPARSGRHEHLFFVAEDCDGDGKLDRLAVVAPHLADRNAESDPASDRETRRHLETLDRALTGLATLRAGRAGAPALSRLREPGGDDALFGRSRSWISCTPYRPTRHPRKGDTEAAIAADIVAECARRGLPRPEVKILGIDTGPRGGLSARASLRFATAVNGPLLLGRESHFGAGLFGAGE
jgi:CRISPR-associated protein Csb2